MAKPTEKRIFLTRHAEAEHNVTKDRNIHDAPLTAFGRQQARDLEERTKDNLQATAQLLVTSPLQRTLSTTVIGYRSLRQRLEQDGKKVIVLPQLQEPRCKLENNPEYAGIDFSPLSRDPDWPSKTGRYRTDPVSLKERARHNRLWLRSQPEREIVVVAHGDILRYMTRGVNTYEDWPNAEIREYRFRVDEEQDLDDAAQLEFVQVFAQEEDWMEVLGRVEALS